MPSVLVSLDKLKDPHSGLGQFSLDLGRALVEVDDPSLDLTYLLPRNRRPLFEGADVTLLDVRPYMKETMARVLRPFVRAFRGGRSIPDLWHAPHQDAKYLPLDPHIPVLLTIHDLNFLRTRHGPKVAAKTRALQRKVDRATAVTTISEFSAEDIRDHVELGGKPLHVIHNGVSGQSGSVVRPAGVPDAPFLFAIGLVCAAKNFHVLVGFLERVPEYHLVIAGGVGDPYAHALRRTIEAKGLKDRFRLLGTVSNEERQWLYQHCDAVLVPSLTEGFGLPVVEGMQEGKPAFMSRATSLPEVGGPLGFYWEGYAADHMVDVFEEGMAVVRGDASYADRLRAHAAGFSWRKAAQGYIGVYRGMLGTGN